MSDQPKMANPFGLTEKQKTELVSQMTAVGLTLDDCRMIVDMASHISEQCGELIVRLAHPAPMHLRLIVVDAALQIIHSATKAEEPAPGLTAEDYATIYGWGGQEYSGTKQ